MVMTMVLSAHSELEARGLLQATLTQALEKAHIAPEHVALVQTRVLAKWRRMFVAKEWSDTALQIYTLQSGVALATNLKEMFKHHAANAANLSWPQQGFVCWDTTMVG